MQLTLTIHGTTLTYQGTPDELTALTRNLTTTELLTPSDPPALDSAPDRNGNTGPCCTCGTTQHSGAAWYQNHRNQLFCWPCADGKPPVTDSTADDSTNHTRWAVRQTTPELATIHRAYCNCPRPIGSILDSGYATNPYAYISRLHANGWTEKIAQADCC